MKARIALLLTSAAVGAHGAIVAADSARGAALFESLACVQCHSLNGQGGHVGPDLGRVVDRNFTPAALAATMWNHAPTMWESMRERGIQSGALDEQGAADLFAYFYSARFFEKPGDAGRGKEVLQRGCGRCHGATTEVQPGAPPLKEWQTVNTPVMLAEAMWNHLPRMQAVAGARRIPLPKISAQDMVDLLVYARNLPGRRTAQVHFETTSGANGEAIFRGKSCHRCHKPGSDLEKKIQGRTLTEIAAEMWNHAPRMIAEGAPPVHFEPGEMRELLSYLWAKQFFEDAGSSSRGKGVFGARGCATCHEDGNSGAPKLQRDGNTFTAAAIVAGLWRHGPKMLEKIHALKMRWPRFEAREMSDLIAWLNAPERRR